MHVWPKQTDWRSCGNRIAGDIEVLAEEIGLVATVFEETNFLKRNHHCPNAHYGYVMACMSWVDHLSLCFQIVDERKQSRRMIAFLDRYFHPGRVEEHTVLVQLFRHGLMHTGGVRFAVSLSRNAVYTYRLHWTPAMGGINHYMVQTVDRRYQDQVLDLAALTHGSVVAPDTRCLNIVISELAADLTRASTHFLEDVARSPQLQREMERAYLKAAIQEVD